MTTKPENFDQMVEVLQQNGGSMPWGNFTNMFKKVPKKAVEKIFVFTPTEKGGWMISLIPPDDQREEALQREKPHAKKFKGHNTNKSYTGTIPSPPENTALAREVSLFSLLPLVNCIINFLEEWSRADGNLIPFVTMRAWLGQMLAAMLLVVIDAPYRTQIWITVQQHLAFLFDWAKFGFSDYGNRYTVVE